MKIEIYMQGDRAAMRLQELPLDNFADRKPGHDVFDRLFKWLKEQPEIDADSLFASVYN